MIQRVTAIIMIVLAVGCVTTAPVKSPSKGTLANLPELKNFTAARYSSYDVTGGNADGRHHQPMQPGETRVMAEIEGAGAITHIWSTIASKEEGHLKKLVLRMYWDGEDTPSVEAPIGDFFGLGHGRYYQYSSLPIQIGVNKGMNCFWRMPFSDGARITVTNEGSLPCIAFYYYIDYEKLEVLPENVGRFHAQYRQTFPCIEGENYVFMEAEGSGHYVGCNLSIHNRAPGWWGEGDDMIYVDGNEQLTLYGTGSEDYFGGAWAYGEWVSQPFSNLYFGCPLNDGTQEQNALWNVYRYHIEDPIPFKESIRVTMEHGHANNRFDDFSSVAYWYQNEPHAPFPALPKTEDRFHAEATIFVQIWTQEAEALGPVFQSEQVVTESTLDHGNFWSSGKHLLFRAEEPTIYRAIFPSSPSSAGEYEMGVWYTAGPNYGQCEIWINEKKVVEWDGYNEDGVVRKKLEKPGIFEFYPGENTIEIRVTGKNEKSSGYHAGWDCFMAEETWL